MTLSIRQLGDADLSNFDAHFARHRAESGRAGDLHFMPFNPKDQVGPTGLTRSALDLRLDEIGWQRWWIIADNEGQVGGHVNLKGDGLKTGLHRCELGIGLEKPYRNLGYGQRLMKTAIDFAHTTHTIEWIDLRVFAHNAAGRRLYQSLGFAEVGVISDRFRVDGNSIDDVIMNLHVV